MIAPNYPPEKQKSAMPKQPNVESGCWADQLRAQALSCNGETNICTPNIDQLAMRGVNFTAAVSGYPLCCPYRGSMLTGLYPNHCTPGHDKRPAAGAKDYRHVLHDAGYHTAYFGKWHLDAEGAAAAIRPNREVFHIVKPEHRGALTIGWGTRTITNPGTVTCMVPTATAPACPALKLTH